MLRNEHEPLIRTFIVAVGIIEPPEPPIAISKFVSLSIIVGVVDDSGLLNGSI